MTDEHARQNVSANIVRLLAAREWKTLRLVEAVGEIVPQNTVYRIVRGETTGSVSVIASIAEVLGVTVDYLLTDPAEHEKRLRGHRKHVLHSA